MTMTRDEIQACVDRIYELTGAGDWDGAAAMMTDDFVISEADHLPMAGTLHGPRAMEQLFGRVFGMVDITGLERIEDCIGGDTCVRLLRLHFAQKGLAPVEIAETFRLRDGKICEVKPYYYNPDAFTAAVAAKKATAGTDA